MKAADLPVKNSELNATSIYEFVVLLKMLFKRSGLRMDWIAQQLRISRSASYNLIDVKLLRFPGDPTIVKEFVALCGLPAHQQDRVMRLWAEISDRRMNLDAEYHVPGMPISHPSGVCCSCSQAADPTPPGGAEPAGVPQVGSVQMGVLLLLTGMLARQTAGTSRSKVA